MRLLLDEMINAAVASQLRERGHDVVAVQEPAFAHLEGLPDEELLDWARGEGRVTVTDDVGDFMALHRRRLAGDEPHAGVLLMSSRQFDRHRHDQFVGRLIRALERELSENGPQELTFSIRWLRPHEAAAR